MRKVFTQQKAIIYCTYSGSYEEHDLPARILLFRRYGELCKISRSEATIMIVNAFQCETDSKPGFWVFEGCLEVQIPGVSSLRGKFRRPTPEEWSQWTNNNFQPF